MSDNIVIIDGLAQFFFALAHGNPWHINMLDSGSADMANPCDWVEFLHKLRSDRPALLSGYTEKPATVDGVVIPGAFGVVRDHDSAVLPACVGKSQHLNQPTEVLEALQELVEPFGGEPSTVGLLDNGVRWFASARVERLDLEIDSTDTVQRYIMAMFGLDGRVSRTYVCNSIRPVCSNTVSAMMSRASAEDMIRKVKNTKRTFDERDEVAREEMAEIIRSFAAENERIMRMVETRAHSTDLETVGQAVFGKSKTAENQIKFIVENGDSFPGQDLPTVDGNVWGIHNKITHFIDHHLNVNGVRTAKQDPASDSATASKLLSHRLFGTGATKRNLLDKAIGELVAQRAPIVGRPMVTA